MCVKDLEQVGGEMGNLGKGNNDNSDEENDQRALHCEAERKFVANSDRLESICEDRVASERQSQPSFLPILRSGEWSDIGGREYMEDTHICIADLAEKFGFHVLHNESVSFYGVFDGHGGKAAAKYVRDHLPRIIVEDADFPSEIEKVVSRSFVQTDAAFAEQCSLEASLSSGTTAISAIIFGRSLVVANAGDCRAVVSQSGRAVEMSGDHRPCCERERVRVESLGAFVDDGYLNGVLGVTRALGDWHLDGLKAAQSGPLIAEPELRLATLTPDHEFLILASDGIWDVFTSQNAVDFARRRLQHHNDLDLCSHQLVDEALKRGAADNLTVLLVAFHAGPPPQLAVPHRPSRVVRRSISAEGLNSLKSLLEP